MAEEEDTFSSLQKDLARKILSYLIDEQWEVGKKVSTPALARQFNVSRSPIAGALQILVQKGILAPSKRRGLEVIKDLSEIDMNKLLPDSSLEQLYNVMMYDRAKGKIPKEVTEAELIPRYKVSRGIIRKLLMRFAADGLAHRMQGHGWQFVDVIENKEATRESYEFRLIIECAAFRAEKYEINTDKLQQVRKSHQDVLDGSETHVDSNTWFQINAKFHETITELSGNRYLTEAIRQQNNLRRMYETSKFEWLAVDRIRQSCEEHIEIIDAILDGDLSWAESLMRQHLRKAMAY